jgi:hypothetical protein
MRGLTLSLIAAATFAFAQPNTVTPEEAAQGWVLLFDGESLFGWTAEGGAKWRVAEGAIVGDAGEYGWLRHNALFSDFEFRTEFRTAADGNSGVFVRSAAGGAPHLTGYEVQIFDGHKQFPTGSLVGTTAAKGAAIRAGEWQTLEVTASGQRIVVKVDSNQVLDTRDGRSAAGHVGLQFNPGKKIEFRNIKLRPLGLKPLIQGSSMTGWKKVEPPKPPQEPAQWSVKDGVIHVEKGPGQLETEGTWTNFVLQMEVRTNPKDANHHPNSGVFMRGTPGVWWSGYESQIRNEYADGDVNKPVDYGTGAIYRSQATRRIVAKDGDYFTKTVIANGRDFNIWINGYPVTSWKDQRPEGTNVRNKEAVLKAGTLSLQAHDPTTNLDFRNIRIAALPAARQ